MVRPLCSYRPVASIAAAFVLTLLAVASPVSAQATNSTNPWPPPANGWHDQSGDMGDAQALYQDIIDGSTREFVAKFWITDYFQNQGVTYFLFALDLQRTPLVGSFDSLINTANGKPIPVYKVETDANGELIKWWIDIANMPPPGTEIDLHATIGSTGSGQYPAGAMALPFNYRWEQINSASGTPEQLYILTEYTVNNPTQSGCAGSLCSLVHSAHLPVPSLDVFATLGAVGIAGVLFVGRSRRHAR
ncbi:MAG: hypothetical protein ACYDDF_05520 [Thermoplasmatota archaeon]